MAVSMKIVAFWMRICAIFLGRVESWLVQDIGLSDCVFHEPRLFEE